MSYLNELKLKTKAELSAIAEDYGISTVKKTKDQLADAIFRFETGVADDEVEIKEVTKKEKPAEDASTFQLVKFTGTNNGFQVGEFTFTRKNPYLAVPPRVASHVYRNWPQKFRPASPDEVKEYYS